MKMDRLVPSTMVFRTLPLKEALKSIREAGFDACELCSVGDWVPHYDLTDGSMEALADLIRTVAESGVRVVAMNFGFSWCDRDGVVSPDKIRQAVNALNAASAVGAKVLTFAAGPICSDEERPELLKIIAGLNGMMARLAALRGIQFSIEAPHKLSISEQPYMIEQFWAAQCKDVHITCDCAHMTYAGFDAADIFRTYRKNAAHVHLRDAIKGNSLLDYGQGTVDFKKYIGIFTEIDYPGYFSMEFPTDSAEEGIARLTHAKEFFGAME